jgi:hypothetical protein
MLFSLPHPFTLSIAASYATHLSNAVLSQTERGISLAQGSALRDEKPTGGLERTTRRGSYA